MLEPGIPCENLLGQSRKNVFGLLRAKQEIWKIGRVKTTKVSHKQ